MKDPILKQVLARIQHEGIDLSKAASEIGIGASALTRHLQGDYVRSDSLAKYRIWLEGASRVETRSAPEINSLQQGDQDGWDDLPLTSKLSRARNVVDLFCGCGGMSLGFERADASGSFRVAMALDIEEPMVRVFNDNHPSRGDLPIARQSDISDFISESEIQAYYLDHVARSTLDHALMKRLKQLGLGGIPALRYTLHSIDHTFIEALTVVRKSTAYVDAIKSVGSSALGQTSVAGFHSATKLPFSGSGSPRLGPLIWHADGDTPSDSSKSVQATQEILRSARKRARMCWDHELEKLSRRVSGSGRGQLASAADRIKKFERFLESHPMERVRKLWIDWRAEREAVRITFFGDESVQKNLRSVYDSDYQVSVLLGGPPCQGFSRIGRGKIRSLREQSLHVHEDIDSVDSRNQLMHQYVMFVAALAPEVFIFENVKHFQAVVRSDGVEYDAADILTESIEAVSERGIGYEAASRIVVASHHAVPQNRERFVMAGVRRDVAAKAPIDAAMWCLKLPRQTPVSLQTALEGLPTPDYDSQSKNSIARTMTVQPSDSESGNGNNSYRKWTFRGDAIDAHIARQPRPDDAAFFSLMGPGKRWMDYRSDASPTLAKMSAFVDRVKSAIERNPKLIAAIGVSSEEVQEIASAVDGSLSLRLLLEGIAPHPGELQHHLLADNYLKKREGAHGDWLARMDPATPSKTIVSHMAKDTYAYVHPFLPRTLSVREAARVQSFPDDYRFSAVGLVDGFKVVGNAVPPLLSSQFAQRVITLLENVDQPEEQR